MGRLPARAWLVTVALLSAVGWVAAQKPAAPLAMPPVPAAPGPQSLPTAVAEPSDRVLPINLATAFQLAHARPLDVQIAARQVTLAARQLDRAKLAWVPNLVTGVDYLRHEGGQQNFAGDVVRSSRGSFAVGAGPNVVFNLSDAIHGPLVARQDLRARRAQQQAVANDSAFAVAEAYFTVQQARGELAGAAVALEKAEEVARKAEKLAEGLSPPLESNRAKVEVARRKQAATAARERWRVASAELVRLLRLEPGTLVEPMEPPFLAVAVIDPSATADALVPIGLTYRPELAAHQAVVQAALARLKQEQLRPLVPSVALRSVATNPSGSIGWAGFGGGPNDKLNGFGSRLDLDLQVMWEFQSLGFGNRARVGERKAEQQVAILELFRVQDRVAAEVTTAFAQVKSATDRMAQSEPAFQEALELVERSLSGMTQTRRVGDVLTLVVRPQEVVAAVQALGQANADFYAAVGDYNRAQFRLYRALGHPAHSLAGAVPQPADALPTPAATPAPQPITQPARPVSVRPSQPLATKPAPAGLPVPRGAAPDLDDRLPPPVPAVSPWDLPLTRYVLTAKPPPAVEQTVYRTPVAPQQPDELPWQPITPSPAPLPTPAPVLQPAAPIMPVAPIPLPSAEVKWDAIRTADPPAKLMWPLR